MLFETTGVAITGSSRHLIPFVALLMVALGGAIVWLWKRSRVVATGLTVWMLLGFAWSEQCWYRQLQPDDSSLALLHCLEDRHEYFATADYHDAYRLTFVVADGHEIERTFTKDESGSAIRTNEAGRFRVIASHLALSYDWQRDEYVCEESCTEWVTTCQDVAEEVCVEQCDVVTYEECWDDCWE